MAYGDKFRGNKSLLVKMATLMHLFSDTNILGAISSISVKDIGLPEYGTIRTCNFLGSLNYLGLREWKYLITILFTESIVSATLQMKPAVDL